MFSTRFLYENMKIISNTISGPMIISSFHKTGKLTPAEFIKAGDALIQHIPTWEWTKGPDNIQPYLPSNKKFLTLKFCMCRERVSLISSTEEKYTDDGWTITSSVLSEIKENTNVADDVVVNIDDIDDTFSDSDTDDARAVSQVDKNMRRYDLTIIYDEYYCTPRLFLFGYDSNNSPLTRAQMMEDVYSENREKTVTIDQHPFLFLPCISIHPCRHAETMQRMIQRVEYKFDEEQTLSGFPEKIPFIFPSHLSLFLFLKFMNSVVPTIEYDISTNF
jgi:ubiquitin-like-conjugating enzyme ATG3